VGYGDTEWLLHVWTVTPPSEDRMMYQVLSLLRHTVKSSWPSPS
jgi:hypothetical protein